VSLFCQSLLCGVCFAGGTYCAPSTGFVRVGNALLHVIPLEIYLKHRKPAYGLVFYQTSLQFSGDFRGSGIA